MRRSQIACLIAATVTVACGLGVVGVGPDEPPLNSTGDAATNPIDGSASTSDDGASAPDAAIDASIGVDAAACVPVPELKSTDDPKAINGASLDIHVDGDPSDWPCKSFTHFSKTSSEKVRATPLSEARFAVAWTPLGFYFVVRVEDSRPLEGQDGNPYKNDAAEVYFGSDDNDGTWDVTKRIHLVVDYNGSARRYWPGGGDPAGAPDDIKVAVRKSSMIFVAEGFIPASYVGVSPLTKRSFDFDIQIDDRHDDNPQAGVFWAYAKSTTNNAQCGTGDHEPACHTQMWTLIDLQ